MAADLPLPPRLEPGRERVTEGDPSQLESIGGGRVERMDQLDAWERLGVALAAGILTSLAPRDRRDGKA